MKRLICVALVLILLIGILPGSTLAAAEVKDTEVIELEDGRYVEITFESSSARIANTVSGSKTYTFYDSDDNMEWKAKLSASYVFTGGSYTCTSASCDVTIYANQWYVVSKTTNYAGNRATANLTMGRKVLGITVEKPQFTINLYCDFNGNLS